MTVIVIIRDEAGHERRGEAEFPAIVNWTGAFRVHVASNAPRLIDMERAPMRLKLFDKATGPSA